LTMPDLKDRVGEVVEASSTGFIAQCYELYCSPPLGSLVRTRDGEVELYGIVFHAATGSLDPGRRPIARGRDEASEEEIYRSSPQLAKLLKSEFSALVVGHREGDALHHYLPPNPARIHAFVYQCLPEEVREFSRSLAFLTVLLNSHLPVGTDELAAAALRHMSLTQEDPHNFLVMAGKELSLLLSGQLNLLKSILWRLK
jgi:hypothetical protein